MAPLHLNSLAQTPIPSLRPLAASFSSVASGVRTADPVLGRLGDAAATGRSNGLRQRRQGRGNTGPSLLASRSASLGKFNHKYFSANRSGLRCERDAFAQADFHDEQPLRHGHMLRAVSAALLFRAITASKGFSIYSELMLPDPVLCPF